MGKSKTYEMLLLMSLCLPEDAELKRYLLIAHITGSSEYVEFRSRTTFKSLFNDKFSLDVISACDGETLGRINQAIKLIPSVLSELVHSIKNGAGPYLTPADVPDFYNADQLSQLLNKLESNSSGANFSNIEPAEYMLLFDDKTLNSAETALMKLPYGDKRSLPELISKSFPGAKYCINKNEISSIMDALEKEAEENLEIMKSEKSIKLNRLFIKGALTLLMASVPYIMHLTGALPTDWFITSEAIIGIIMLLYFLLG